MSAFFFTSASGWIASILIALEIALPYLLRPTRRSRLLGTAAAPSEPYLERMKPHYWVGYALLPLSTAHAWVPMQSGFAKRANAAGLWFATLSLGFLFAQAVLGIALQNAPSAGRATARTWHFWAMAAIALLVTLHVWLNG